MNSAYPFDSLEENSMGSPIHTLIVADAIALRNTLVAWVKSMPGLQEISSTDDCAAALALAARWPVDVLVVDASLPAPARHVLLHHARAADPSIRFVIVADGAAQLR
jgi:DNA-binding NarL/FixJ family response regulator